MAWARMSCAQASSITVMLGESTCVHFVCRVADVFAQMNNKMGGDLKKIQTTGAYFVEIWKAIGMEGIGTSVRSGNHPHT